MNVCGVRAREETALDPTQRAALQAHWHRPGGRACSVGRGESWEGAARAGLSSAWTTALCGVGGNSPFPFKTFLVTMVVVMMMFGYKLGEKLQWGSLRCWAQCIMFLGPPCSSPPQDSHPCLCRRRAPFLLASASPILLRPCPLAKVFFARRPQHLIGHHISQTAEWHRNLPHVDSGGEGVACPVDFPEGLEGLGWAMAGWGLKISRSI